MKDDFRPYYTYSTDLVSLLTVLACAVRLPIYYACNARIRREVNSKLFLLLKIFKCCLSEKKLQTQKFGRESMYISTLRF